MKKALLIALPILLLAILTGWLLLRSDSSDVASDPVPSVNFPQTDPATDDIANNGAATITAYSGQELVVRDFLADADTFQDPINQEYYYLGSALPPPGEPTDAPYEISYTVDDSHFNVSILQEPIGSVRLDAESYLRQKLGLQEEMMCGLNYTVSVPYSVNAIYSGSNLGFSFCPDAVVLP